MMDAQLLVGVTACRRYVFVVTWANHGGREVQRTTLALLLFEQTIITPWDGLVWHRASKHNLGKLRYANELLVYKFTNTKVGQLPSVS